MRDKIHHVFSHSWHPFNRSLLAILCIATYISLLAPLPVLTPSFIVHITYTATCLYHWERINRLSLCCWDIQYLSQLIEEKRRKSKDIPFSCASVVGSGALQPPLNFTPWSYTVCNTISLIKSDTHRPSQRERDLVIGDLPCYIKHNSH